jgi:aldose 1-epimerase
MTEQTGQKLESTVLSARGGLEVELLNFGAALKSIQVPVGDERVNVLLTYPDNEDYLQGRGYLGATVGRYAGRIDSGVASLQGRSIQLVQNEQKTGHCLHGGEEGFSQKFWSLDQQTDDSVTYEYVSVHGEQGFPGCLTTRVCYRLVGPTSLQIEYTARTDRETFVNLSNHAYFNLNKTKGRIDNHELWINSDQYAPLAENILPTGEIRRVADTVFDFRQRTRLGERLKSEDPQLKLTGGFDHYFLLNKAKQQADLAAVVYSPDSGITMKLLTDQPGVLFYSGTWLDKPFEPREGLCLEFQDIPNAPNMDGFPSTVLRPGEIYRRRITLEFNVQEIA